MIGHVVDGAVGFLLLAFAGILTYGMANPFDNGETALAVSPTPACMVITVVTAAGGLRLLVHAFGWT